MWTSIFKGAAALLSIISTALGWARDSSLKNEGRQLQAADDLTAMAKGDKDAQKVREIVAGMSTAELDSELRGGSSPSRG